MMRAGQKKAPTRLSRGFLVPFATDQTLEAPVWEKMYL